jgi:hypothetical protein
VNYCPLAAHTQDLRCSVDVESYDPDEHTFVYFFEWMVGEGQERTSSSAAWAINGLSQQVYQSSMADYETWTCMVRARDELKATSEPDTQSCTLPDCSDASKD